MRGMALKAFGRAWQGASAHLVRRAPVRQPVIEDQPDAPGALPHDGRVQRHAARLRARRAARAAHAVHAAPRAAPQEARRSMAHAPWAPWEESRRVGGLRTDGAHPVSGQWGGAAPQEELRLELGRGGFAVADRQVQGREARLQPGRDAPRNA